MYRTTGTSTVTSENAAGCQTEAPLGIEGPQCRTEPGLILFQYPEQASNAGRKSNRDTGNEPRGPAIYGTDSYVPLSLLRI